LTGTYTPHIITVMRMNGKYALPIFILLAPALALHWTLKRLDN
jgi:hypothetical protein